MKAIIRIFTFVSFAIVILAGLYWLYPYLLYSTTLENKEETWIKQTFIPSRIEGQIYQLDPPTGKNCFSNLIIATTDGGKYAVGICLCDDDQTFGRFATVGDSIYKPAGSDQVTVIKKSGKRQEFNFPFCDH